MRKAGLSAGVVLVPVTIGRANLGLEIELERRRK
jgi:hypothetical protein